MKVHVTDPQGNCVELQALAGFRVMEVIRDWSEESGIGIKAECGGACACATCHVYLDEEWLDKVPAIREDEEYRLDEAFGVEQNSRLSCQLIVNEQLDGLSVTIAADASVHIDAPQIA